MGIELNIRITSPLAEDDRDLLSGIAVMTLAIANHEMAKSAFPETFGDDDGLQPEPPGPAPCAFINPEQPDQICVGSVSHRGRHRFRRIGTRDGGDGTVLPN